MIKTWLGQVPLKGPAFVKPQSGKKFRNEGDVALEKVGRVRRTNILTSRDGARPTDAQSKSVDVIAST